MFLCPPTERRTYVGEPLRRLAPDTAAKPLMRQKRFDCGRSTPAAGEQDRIEVIRFDILQSQIRLDGTAARCFTSVTCSILAPFELASMEPRSGNQNA